MCRSGPLDTLIMFTTTVSFNNIYSTSSVIIVPIILFYITVVVVLISFSIIVSCISLLLVTEKVKDREQNGSIFQIYSDAK